MAAGRKTTREATRLIVLAALALHGALAASSVSREEALPLSPTSINRDELEALRQSGDLQSQRRHVWEVIAQLTQSGSAGALPRFESWYGEDAVFATERAEHASRGIRAFSRVSSDQEHLASRGVASAPSADIPILTYTLYNAAAYNHIRTHRLHLLSELKRLSAMGPEDASVVGDRSVPPFPAEAIVLKTAWWPVARDRLTALPVWDPDNNPPRPSGNDYTTWPRVVAVDPSPDWRTVRTAHVDFAGRSFQSAHRIDLKEFYHVVIDAGLAQRLARDRSARKAALIVLGRPIEAGDSLVLVGANLATKEIKDWVWATFWWHDRANEGPYAVDRPALGTPWSNYLLQVAFDSDKPAALDGEPHVCFNPWLEGRFPDGGHGGGTVSNCLTCHRRASYPSISFLPVSRGAPDLANDPAFAPGRLRTNFIWSIAMHARPRTPRLGDAP
jgi:hypothetical protein